MIRIATFNLENLFTRPTAMHTATDSEGRKAIEDHALANSIVGKDVYSPEDKATLVALSGKYRWHELNQPAGALIQLQKIRGQLFRMPQGGPLSVAANGRKDWVGWFELLRENVSWEATYNTGRVIKEVNPDILITVEVENRPTLLRFNDQVLKTQFGFHYPHVMVIDGNDDRGIDLGIMSKYPIVAIRSHVDDRNENGFTVFSRDCPEYDILLPNNVRLVILPNHLKSKRSGNDEASRKRRVAQAKRAHSIAVSALARSAYVLIGGDLNDTPDSAALQELLVQGFDDVMSHPSYPADRPGTYNTGLISHKIDYLILSTALKARLQNTGIERRGSYHPHTSPLRHRHQSIRRGHRPPPRLGGFRFRSCIPGAGCPIG